MGGWVVGGGAAGDMKNIAKLSFNCVGAGALTELGKLGWINKLPPKELGQRPHLGLVGLYFLMIYLLPS